MAGTWRASASSCPMSSSEGRAVTETGVVREPIRASGMDGRPMGAVRTTVQDLKVVRVDSDRNLILLNGSVPGPSGAVVMVRASTDRRGRKQ